MGAKNKQELQDFVKGNISEVPSKKKEEKEPERKKEEDTEEEYGKKVKGALENKEGAPPKEQIEKWKAEHGGVFVSAFSENEVFIWRVLSRSEYRRLQVYLSQADREQFSQADYEEAVVDTVMLWPSQNSEEYNSLAGKAGTYSTLYEQISQASNFVSAPIAGYLMAEL